MREYKNYVNDVKDKNGKIIQERDVCKLPTGELVNIRMGCSHAHKLKGLKASNQVIGLNVWLDTFEDGVLDIVGNWNFNSKEEENA